jgi:hypothetical protein
MTGATPVDRKAGKVKKVPPPATALTAEPDKAGEDQETEIGRGETQHRLFRRHQAT